MIHFVFGGLYQGQEEYIKENYPNAFWAKDLDFDKKLKSVAIYPAEVILKDLDFIDIEKMLDSINGTIIIAGNEIGMGVVPLDSLQRKHRDKIGFIYQMISKKADRVTRCIMGICEDIK